MVRIRIAESYDVVSMRDVSEQTFRDGTHPSVKLRDEYFPAELPGSQVITEKPRRTGVDDVSSILHDVEQPVAEDRKPPGFARRE